MGKVLATIGGIALLATGIGAAAGALVLGTTLAVAASSVAIAGISLSTIAAIGAVASIGGALLAKKPNAKSIQTAQERLYASIVPTASRKQVFGRTAMATDVRYHCFTGSNKEYYHQIVCCASHKVEAIEELWLDDKQAWTVGGGVTAGFTGYLTVAAVLEGNSGNAINVDGIWNAANGCRLTGCAYLHLRFKVTGNSKKVESPFASSIPNRMTIRGKGRLVYDPRRDTTRGGTGSHRADDQTTWAYSVGGDEIGRNAALAELANLLGWKINGKLAVGRGTPPDRIDFDSFIAAANVCDEAAALAAGGSEPRYRFDGLIGEDEDGAGARANIESAMAGALRDASGRLACKILTNDLASPVVSFDDDDLMGAIDWLQTDSLEKYRNVVIGKYVDASDAGLYQLVDYPQASVTAPDGIDRIHQLTFPGVQSVTQAQRLRAQALQRFQYDGVFVVPVNAKGFAAKIDDIVELTTNQLGWTDMPFRVAGRGLRFDGICEMILTIEHADMYAWDTGDELTPVVAGGPIEYDWMQHPLIQANIEDNADVTLRVSVAPKTTVACDYTGAAKAGQLPKTLTFTLLQGTAEDDVTADAAWSYAVTVGTGSVAAGAADGLASLSAITTDRIEVTATAVLGAATRTGVQVVEKLVDSAPVGGGGSGSGTVTDTTISNTTASTYGSANASCSSVVAGAGGNVDLSFPGSFTRVTSGVGDAYGKWQWSAAGAGTWADVAAEIAAGATSFTNTPDGTYDPGSIAVTQQKTGLTPGTAYDFRLLLRNASGTYTQNWTGTAAAVGT